MRRTNLFGTDGTAFAILIFASPVCDPAGMRGSPRRGIARLIMHGAAILVLLMASPASATGGPTPEALIGWALVMALFLGLSILCLRACMRLAREKDAGSPRTGRKAFLVSIGALATLSIVFLLLPLGIGFPALFLLPGLIYLIARGLKPGKERGSSPSEGDGRSPQ